VLVVVFPDMHTKFCMLHRRIERCGTQSPLLLRLSRTGRTGAWLHRAACISALCTGEIHDFSDAKRHKLRWFGIETEQCPHRGIKNLMPRMEVSINQPHSVSHSILQSQITPPLVAIASSACNHLQRHVPATPHRQDCCSLYV
jgi:hypothetical protein